MEETVREVLEKFEEKGRLSYGEISRVYEDESVLGVHFFSNGNACYIKDVRLINGEVLSFP